MLLKHFLWIYLFTITDLAIAIKNQPKQCLRYRENDVFLNTSPAYSPVDFSAALFPDPAIISGLSKDVNDEPTKAAVLKKTSIAIDEQLSTLTSQIDEPDEPKPLVSFEEWQKKVLQENEKDRRHKRKSAEEGTTGGLKRQQMVDSIDGGFSDDFGSMFEELIGGVVEKEKKPNVYDEGEYIAPSKAGERNTNKKIQPVAGVRMKSLKERFNYASTDCAATVRKANNQAKGAQSILYESKDQYLLNKCAADKFVIINLCEQIVVDTIVMANFEFFSSTFKDFRVYASSKYPTKDWRLLGQWQARNTRDLQVFKVPDSGFVEYMKIEFLTHYGHEYYCPLSLVRVHGMSMMEYYTTVESQGDDPIIENEHLWPAEVREQLIQPQYDVTNTSESFPIKNDVDEEDIKPIIPPINYDIVVDSPLTSNTHESDMFNGTEVIATDQEQSLSESDVTETDPMTESYSTTATIFDRLADQNVSYLILSSPSPSSRSTASVDLSESISNDPSNTFEEDESDTNNSMTVSSSTKSDTTVSAARLNITATADNIIPFSNAAHPTLLTSTSMTSEESRSTHLLHSKTTSNNYPKEGSTQESIYKTIMKRLNVLEGNMTLSLRYLDDQNKNLNGVLKDMEKKHQDQLIQLIGHLNETASHRIDSMKRRYEQWYEDLKDQTDSDMREMTTKINILADQLSFERRVSVSQLVIMITLFVFMALSRGTFSTLSPVMAAQQEERKRRESIDQSSALSKEAMNTLMNRSTVNVVAQKTTEPPKKPGNPRRHSDNPYHIMGESEIHKDDTPPKLMPGQYDSLGIELQNDVLQRKLGDIFLQQQSQKEQDVPILKKTSRKASLENLRQKDDTTVKNRKRSSTSPSAIE